MNNLLKDEIQADEEFWGQDYFKEEENDKEYKSETGTYILKYLLEQLKYEKDFKFLFRRFIAQYYNHQKLQKRKILISFFV